MKDMADKVRAAIAEKDRKMFDDQARHRAIYRKVCPDCAGSLVDISSIARKWFSLDQHYLCTSCNRLHIMHEEDI